MVNRLLLNTLAKAWNASRTSDRWKKYGSRISEALDYVCRQRDCSRNGFLWWYYCNKSCDVEPPQRITREQLLELNVKIEELIEERKMSKQELELLPFLEELSNMSGKGDVVAEQLLSMLRRLAAEYVADVANTKSKAAIRKGI